MRKICVAGSRGYPDKAQVLHWLDVSIGIDDTLIVGGAAGVDSWAQKWAEENGIPYDLHLAQWDVHGKRAGYVRNCVMVGEADEVVVFWDGISKGSKHTIDLALQWKIPLQVVYPDA